MSTTSCEICHSPDTVLVNIRAGLEYLICRRCGHALLETPGESLLERFSASQEKYFGEDTILIKPGDPAGEESMAKRRALFSRFVDEPANVLEVGPGGGAFLRWVTAEGHRVSAVEDSQTLADSLRSMTGADVDVGSFEKSELPSSSRDVFCSFHVIEHVPEPKAHLEEAARVVRPGGLAFVATPNATSWQQRLFPALSPNFDSAHLRVFSEQSLLQLARDSGWNVVWKETPEYTSGWLRVLSKALRKLRGEDEEDTAGKYSANLSRRTRLILAVLTKITWPMRTAQSRLHGGNEIFLVLRRGV